jgi:hypothetical protein
MLSKEDNPYASPQSARDDPPQVKRPSYVMSPAPVEGAEDVGRSSRDSLTLRMYLSLAAVTVVGYVALAVTYPTIWAILTGIAVASVLGLVTTKVVLRIDNPLKMWCLTPVFGVGWLLLLWILFQLKALF